MAALPKEVPPYQHPTGTEGPKIQLDVHRGGKGEHPRRRFGKLFAAAAVIVTLAGGGGWIATHQGTTGPGSSEKPGATRSFEPTPGGSATVIKTEAPTTPPTEAPTPVPAGFTQKEDGTITWKGTDKSGKEVNLDVPQIPGLQAKMENGKVIYVAEAGNRYGLKVDGKTEVVDYNPLVSVEGKQVGGLALKAPIAEWYLKNTADVNGMPPIISPVDLRTATNVSISNGTIQNVLGDSFTDIEITAEGKVSVNDMLPGTRTLIVSYNMLQGTGVLDSASQDVKKTDKWVDLVFQTRGLPTLPNPTKFSLGQNIGTTDATVHVTNTVHGNGNLIDTNSSEMLRIGNCVVSAFN